MSAPTAPRILAAVLVPLAVALGVACLWIGPRWQVAKAEARPPAPPAGQGSGTAAQPPRGRSPPSETRVTGARPPTVASPPSQAPEFVDSFEAAALDEQQWQVTRKNDFAAFAVDVAGPAGDGVTGRLRLRAGTIGTDDKTVKFFGVVSRSQLSLAARKTLSLSFDWNNQANGCYLTGAVYLCPTLTAGGPADEPQWLKIEYAGVPPGRNARAAVWLKDQYGEHWLYDEGWPKEQKTGRRIGKVQIEIRFDQGAWTVLEDGRPLFAAGEKHRLGFDRAYLYLQATSHSNYPPRELFFDDVMFGPSGPN